MQLQQLIKKAGILILTLLIIASTATAQDLLKGNNLANVRVDQVSDADIAKLKAQLTAQGMTIEQAEPMAIAKGMSAAEFAKLKDRVKNGGINTAAGANKTGIVSARDASASDSQTPKNTTRPQQSHLLILKFLDRNYIQVLLQVLNLTCHLQHRLIMCLALTTK